MGHEFCRDFQASVNCLAVPDELSVGGEGHSLGTVLPAEEVGSDNRLVSD